MNVVIVPDIFTTNPDTESPKITHTGPLTYLLDLSKETQANTKLLKILCDIGDPLHTYTHSVGPETFHEWVRLQT